MRKSFAALLSACLVSSACVADNQAANLSSNQSTPKLASPAPEFQGIDHWINSKPLTMHSLRGKPVLVEFWTFDCINCIHVVPHVKAWHEKYSGKGLAVVGVHTPEYGHERVTANVEEAVKHLGIRYPVAQDNAYATWNAYGNQYWPALYLIDAQGRIVYSHFGEGNYDETERRIVQLLGK
jgi:thiol-disulfide isomerase/thioredoxin